MQNCPGCWQDWVPLSISCAETEAAEWRLTIGTKRAYDLKYVRLSSAARLDNWQGLAGWTLRGVAKSGNTGQQKATWVDAGKILDVSANMKPDGSFSAILPAGEWTILRFGHVNMGTRNAPAPEEATGWKCDRRIPL